jgi:hypothetical protein
VQLEVADIADVGALLERRRQLRGQPLVDEEVAHGEPFGTHPAAVGHGGQGFDPGGPPFGVTPLGHNVGMADWSPLRKLLADVEDRLTMSWSDLDRLVGGLPRSAYDHPAFWKGDRSGWPGFTTIDVRVGEAVTFVPLGDRQTNALRRSVEVASSHGATADPADVVLIGCVKSKLDRPAQARDLYTSALFRKGRAHAETIGVPWFVLSAEHGLVEPSQVIEPYELDLSSTSRIYRTTWGKRVIEDLAARLGTLHAKTIEIHAGAAYVEAVRDGFEAAGATMVEPLAGLTMGERLAWYGRPAPLGSSALPGVPPDQVDELVRRLRDREQASTPAEFLARGRTGLDCPGLYSWWTDQEGAAELSRGLREDIAPGLVYAGLAGATRSRSRRRSTNTLWGRLHGMHLGSRSEFSTFRRSLGSILAEVSGANEIDEEQLTAWMHDHLRLIAVPVDDADALDRIETEVLAQLDPPLNLAKMPKTAVRSHLTELRRRRQTTSPGHRRKGSARSTRSGNDIEDFERALIAHEVSGTHLARLAERTAWDIIRSRFPSASTVEVEGWMNEDWLRVLRVRRVLDPEGVVLFDVARGADPNLEEAIDDVGTEYLDLLLELTGDAYMGHHELAEPSS